MRKSDEKTKKDRVREKHLFMRIMNLRMLVVNRHF